MAKKKSKAEILKQRSKKKEKKFICLPYKMVHFFIISWSYYCSSRSWGALFLFKPGSSENKYLKGLSSCHSDQCVFR